MSLRDNEIQALVERLRNHVAPNWEAETGSREPIDQAASLILSQSSTITSAREVIEFYRDGFRYHPKRSTTGINLSEWKPTDALLEDCGERARAWKGSAQ